jgi:hypothetical protein
VHEQAERRQPFVQVAYRVDLNGTLVAALPSHCPGSSGGEACRVTPHHRRARSQGPEHALVVAHCHEHGRSFTLYPPGWVPYGRRALCRVTPGGCPVRSDSVDGTLLGATEDAAAGKLWPRSSAGPNQGVQRTQGRLLACASQKLGVSPALGERIREAIATCLGVPLLVLHEACRSYARVRSWRERGRVLMEVLRRIGARRQLPELWSRAGYVAGLWGRPSRWDPGGARNAAGPG